MVLHIDIFLERESEIEQMWGNVFVQIEMEQEIKCYQIVAPQ